MILTPTEFQDSIFNSHKLAVEVWVSDGTPGSDVQVYPNDGSVTLDNTAAIRGNVSLTFNDPSLIPVGAESLLTPYGNELRVSRGIEVGDFRYLVQLGVFVIQDVSVSADGGIQVTAADRSQTVTDAVFESVYTIPVASDWVDTIQAIVGAVIPLQEVDLDEIVATSTTTISAEQGSDRWSFVQDMAAIIGCYLYFNNEGVLTLRTIAERDDAAALSIVDGVDGVEVTPALTDLSRTWSRRETHNKWIVISDNPSGADAPPASATAIDDDPDSPTNYFGRFGPKPEIWHSSMIGALSLLDAAPTEAAMCQIAANGKKAKESGLAQMIDFGSLVHPALEPNDVVRVKRTFRHQGETIMLADETHVIDSLTMPLTADGTMEAQTRSTFRGPADEGA